MFTDENGGCYSTMQLRDGVLALHRVSRDCLRGKMEYGDVRSCPYVMPWIDRINQNDTMKLTIDRTYAHVVHVAPSPLYRLVSMDQPYGSWWIPLCALQYVEMFIEMRSPSLPKPSVVHMTVYRLGGHRTPCNLSMSKWSVGFGGFVSSGVYFLVQPEPTIAKTATSLMLVKKHAKKTVYKRKVRAAAFIRDRWRWIAYRPPRGCLFLKASRRFAMSIGDSRRLAATLTNIN